VNVLLDAGPSLNFLAVGQQSILVKLSESHSLQMAAPARVDVEVRGMCKNPRFSETGALSTWQKLRASGRVQILDDTLTGQAFTAAVTRISGMPAKERARSPKSLGEIMVLAHASVFAQGGQHVFVLMDDRDGRSRARAERAWLRRQKAPGELTLWSTPQVLRNAGDELGWIVNGLTWQDVYEQMQKFDDGLVPLT
jgi:hypothetical protein